LWHKSSIDGHGPLLVVCGGEVLAPVVAPPVEASLNDPGRGRFGTVRRTHPRMLDATGTGPAGRALSGAEIAGGSRRLDSGVTVPSRM
jgi:hypothetical protein